MCVYARWWCADAHPVPLFLLSLSCLSNLAIEWQSCRAGGAATFYVSTFKDVNDDLFRGEAGYKPHISPNVPAQQFWALTIYDRETRGFIRDMPRPGIDSYDENMRRNGERQSISRG